MGANALPSELVVDDHLCGIAEACELGKTEMGEAQIVVFSSGRAVGKLSAGSMWLVPSVLRLTQLFSPDFDHPPPSSHITRDTSFSFSTYLI